MIVLPNARRLVSPPAEEPISLQTAKNHCLVRHTLDDALFNIWIRAARRRAEILSGERMITQQWEYVFPNFPPRLKFFPEVLKLPIKPIQTLDSIVYIDATGTAQTFGTLSGSPLTPEEYELVRDTEQPYVALKVNQDWPVTGTVANAVRVTMTVGHNDTAAAFADNPQTQLLVSGMLLLIGHFNENREAVMTDARAAAIEIPMGVEALLRSPKVG